MKIHDYEAIVDLAMTRPGRQTMRPVVEKEILHYDIFAALDKENLLSDLVFQGGTSLRLCWQSNRFSEDLYFAGGRDFDVKKFVAIKNAIETHIGERYRLLVNVKEPKQLAEESDALNIQVNKWQVSVETSPGERNLPRQKIKIEIANVPAYTEELRPILQNYDFLSGYGGNILVRVETLNEIMADKVLAFPATAKIIRYRDIWDLAFLTQRGATLDPTLVIKKINDYGTQNYEALLIKTIQTLPEVIRSKNFLDQMKRFIDSETLQNTIEKEGFLPYLESTVVGIFNQMLKAMGSSSNETDDVPTFKM